MENIFGEIAQDAQMVKRKSGSQNWIQITMPPPITVIYCGVEEGKLNSEMSLQVKKFINPAFLSDPQSSLNVSLTQKMSVFFYLQKHVPNLYLQL